MVLQKTWRAGCVLRGAGLAAALGAAILCGRGARAAVVAPGETAPTFGVTTAARPELAGVIVGDQATDFAQDAGESIVSGTLLSRVVREDIAGTLDFYYQVIVDPDSVPLAGLTAAGFTGWQTDADNRLDGSGEVAFTSATRSGDGAAVTLSFAPTTLLPGGASSRFAFIRTDATAYHSGAAVTLLGGVSGDTPAAAVAFGPAPSSRPTAVPLPPAAWVGLLGLAAVALMTVRFRVVL